MKTEIPAARLTPSVYTCSDGGLDVTFHKADGSARLALCFDANGESSWHYVSKDEPSVMGDLDKTLDFAALKDAMRRVGALRPEDESDE